VDAIRRFGAVDATTNPTLILKAEPAESCASLGGNRSLGLGAQSFDKRDHRPARLEIRARICQDRAWPRVDGSRRGSIFLFNEDAMATEKLAEGIRDFARDLRALREQVSKRLQEAA
jgi:transaldolase